MSSHRTQGGARTRANKPAPPSSRPARNDTELKRFTAPVPDALVLAGVQRAEVQWIRPNEGAVMSQIAEHLGYQHAPWTTRNIRPQLERLTSEGLLDAQRIRGIRRWAINPAGRRRLAAARRRGPLELPESPQHRHWRHARAKAAERISEIRALFAEALTEGTQLLDQDAPESLELLILADRLKQTSWQLGSALYCLNEWPEPDETKPDHETHVTGSTTYGRRSLGGWKDREQLDERHSAADRH
jgi:DNA-binding PadR family transcriptional regulator